MQYKEISLADKPIIDTYVNKEGFRTCDGAFANYFAWRDNFKISWCIEKNFLIIRATRYGDNFYLPPMGGKDEDLLDVLNQILDENDGYLCMHGVVEEDRDRILKVMPDIEFVDDREDWDYIYLREKLATLSGRKLHGQKNHYNAFCKAHPDFVYEEMNETNLHECLALGDAWCDAKLAEDPTIEEERIALHNCLANFKALGLRGGLLRFDGKVQAFSYGSKINSDTAVLHVEKAVQGVRGLYIAMTKEFAAHAWDDVIYLNREEDIGIPGLRKAKEELHPEFMLIKYNCHYHRPK